MEPIRGSLSDSYSPAPLSAMVARSRSAAHYSYRYRYSSNHSSKSKTIPNNKSSQPPLFHTQSLLTTLLFLPAAMSLPGPPLLPLPIPRPLRPEVRQTNPSYPVPEMRIIGEAFFVGITKYSSISILRRRQGNETPRVKATEKARPSTCNLE